MDGGLRSPSAKLAASQNVYGRILSRQPHKLFAAPIYHRFKESRSPKLMIVIMPDNYNKVKV